MYLVHCPYLELLCTLSLNKPKETVNSFSLLDPSRVLCPFFHSAPVDGFILTYFLELISPLSLEIEKCFHKNDTSFPNPHLSLYFVSLS